MNIVLFGRGIENKDLPILVKFMEQCNQIKVALFLSAGLSKALHSYSLNPKLSFSTFDGVFPNQVIDLIISIGGDGTFLRASKLIEEREIPIAGINTGRLGFLAETPISELMELFAEFMDEKVITQNRSQLEITAVNKNKTLKVNKALNEVAILRKDTSSLIVIHVRANNQFLNSYWADGLIISTPTGSTAYSMSAGGPIMVPSAKSIVLTPIAPHSLTTRPMVLPEDVDIQLQIESRSTQFMISIDSYSEALETDVEINIKKAKEEIVVVQRSNYDFFCTLRKKLMWGQDIRTNNR